MEELVYELECISNLYTKICVIPVNIYQLVCVNKTCIIKWDGGDEDIFRVSKYICIGEELCWEFVDMVSTMKSNFNAFCKLMDNTYLRHQSTKKFMSAKTFRKLFFAWASNQDVEFRTPCKSCGFSPRILACDATKIGIHQSVTDIVPVEPVDVMQADLVTPHRRFDRCFLAYILKPTPEEKKASDQAVRKARNHLKIITNVNSPIPNMRSPMNIEGNANLLSVAPSYAKALIEKFLQIKLPPCQHMATMKFLHILSYDAPLRAVIPTPLLDLFRNISLANPPINEIKRFSPSVANFLKAFVDQDGLLDELIINFMSSLCNEIIQIHTADIPPESPNSISSSYNPPKHGRAYYFSPSGQQIRSPRSFSIDLQQKHVSSR